METSSRYVYGIVAKQRKGCEIADMVVFEAT